MTRSDLALAILAVLPRNLLSWTVGKLADIPLPAPASQWLIRNFARAYKIDLDEIERPLESYRTLAAFFVRRLKSGARKISSAELICPADGVMTTTGKLEKSTFIQAKGIEYPLHKLLGSGTLADQFAGGTFATIYLAPHNYHRVHVPVSGIVRNIVYIPGTLWPVNVNSVMKIRTLFAINERVIVLIETAAGTVGVVFVGATNVGSIRLAHIKFRSNLLGRRKRQRDISPETPIAVLKGEELGAFHFGSTVVLLFSKEFGDRVYLPDGPVQMGEPLSEILTTAAERV